MGRGAFCVHSFKRRSRGRRNHATTITFSTRRMRGSRGPLLASNHQSPTVKGLPCPSGAQRTHHVHGRQLPHVHSVLACGFTTTHLRVTDMYDITNRATQHTRDCHNRHTHASPPTTTRLPIHTTTTICAGARLPRRRGDCPGRGRVPGPPGPLPSGGPGVRPRPKRPSRMEKKRGSGRAEAEAGCVGAHHQLPPVAHHRRRL